PILDASATGIRDVVEFAAPAEATNQPAAAESRAEACRCDAAREVASAYEADFGIEVRLHAQVIQLQPVTVAGVSEPSPIAGITAATGGGGRAGNIGIDLQVGEEPQVGVGPCECVGIQSADGRPSTGGNHANAAPPQNLAPQPHCREVRGDGARFRLVVG